MKRHLKIDNFLEKVVFEPNTGCWLWGGVLDKNGYGIAVIPKSMESVCTTLRAHRISYIYHKGVIADGLPLDHLCRMRCCVNPDHLEPVSSKENARRRYWRGNGLSEEKYCMKGHLLDESNVYVLKKNGVFKQRMCKICRLEYGRKHELKRKGKRDYRASYIRRKSKQLTGEAA